MKMVKYMKIFMRVVIILITVIFIMPIAISVISSLMTPTEIMYRTGNLQHDIGRPEGLTFMPETISIRQYYMVMVESSGYLVMFWNSVLYATSITAATLLLAIPVAFLFAKIRLSILNKLFFIFIVVMMLPFQVSMLSNYMILSKIGLIGTRLAVIIPTVFAPTGVFLLRQTMRSIPDEQIDAMLLESSSVNKVLIYVILPGIKPGIITTGILVFAESWNMIDRPGIFLNQMAEMPLSLALNGLIFYSPESSFAGSVVFMLPMLFIFLLFHKKIIKGLEYFIW